MEGRRNVFGGELSCRIEMSSGNRSRGVGSLRYRSRELRKLMAPLEYSPLLFNLLILDEHFARDIYTLSYMQYFFFYHCRFVHYIVWSILLKFITKTTDALKHKILNFETLKSKKLEKLYDTMESVQAFVYIFYENMLFYTCKMSNKNYKL